MQYLLDTSNDSSIFILNIAGSSVICVHKWASLPKQSLPTFSSVGKKTYWPWKKKRKCHEWMSEAKTAEGELRSSADISWEMKGFERIWKRQMRSARLIGKVCQKCGRCVFVFPTELLKKETQLGLTFLWSLLIKLHNRSKVCIVFRHNSHIWAH